MSSKSSILIIDDHPAIRTTLKDILEDEGYRVNTADSGLRGIELFRKKKYNLVFLDVRLPDISGIDVFRQINDSSADTRVIMMTAYSMDDKKRETLENGAAAFLQKPLDIENVLSIIKNEVHPPVLILMKKGKERDEISGRLRSGNYRIHLSDSPEDALDLERQIKFNLIMIDTAFGPKNSPDFYRAIGEASPGSVIMLFSEEGKNKMDRTGEASRPGKYMYFKKPLDIDSIITAAVSIKRRQKSGFVLKQGG